IEKIGLMNEDGTELESLTIERTNQPQNFGYIDASILPWSGKAKIFAKCNLHDLWINTVNVSDIR
ncbi:MAG: hypothetical protein KDK38_16050, partial [Leptospiraceae bacterium]|nr:hypothetical protein [Leptospiraceae bacterium]